MKMNNELLVKAKEAKTIEELMAIAKENGMELTEESANAYFELLHSKTGEISDEELDNVSGGGCYKGDRLIVSACLICDMYVCNKCGGGFVMTALQNAYCKECGRLANCTNCKHCSYEKGLWLCNNEN